MSHSFCYLHNGEERLKLGKAFSQRENGRNCDLLLKVTGTIVHVFLVTAPSEKDHHSGAAQRKGTCHTKGRSSLGRQERIWSSCDGATRVTEEERAIKQALFGSKKFFDEGTICSLNWATKAGRLLLQKYESEGCETLLFAGQK